MPQHTLQPKIEAVSEKKLVGKRLSMSFAEYRVADLWKSFMPRRKEISNNITNDLISLVVYKSSHFENFKPTNNFEKWATVEVASFDNVLNGMEKFVLPGGLYAVFSYRGLNTDHSIFQYILETWLPSSAYVLDDRPHFEILGDKYRNNDPTSEEEICIPIKLR
jgi:AraC family transcriptional regulator